MKMQEGPQGLFSPGGGRQHCESHILRLLDFSSAFNTIRPFLLGTKPGRLMQADAPLAAWITNYLTSRPQYVRLQSNMSDTILSNTGAAQGTVLSPFLFTHLRLQTLLTVLPPAEVFGRLCHCGLYQQGAAVRVQKNSLQNHAVDVLSLDGGQRHLLRCCVLGQQGEGS